MSFAVSTSVKRAEETKRGVVILSGSLLSGHRLRLIAQLWLPRFASCHSHAFAVVKPKIEKLS